MNDEFTKEELPSFYDFFYYDSWIINNLCELDPIKKFLNTNEYELKNVYCGFLYLFELALISLINHIENLIEDVDISDLIHWGEVSNDNENIVKTIESHPEVKNILSLLKIRRKLSIQRFGEKYNEEEIINLLGSSKEILHKYNDFLNDEYKISRVEKNGQNEIGLILNWILSKYNYIEIAFDPITNNQEDAFPEWPNPPIFYLMPSNLSENYYLQNPRIKSNVGNYLKGFSLTLLYLYKILIPNKIMGFEQDVINVKNWCELHNVGRRIQGETVKKSCMLTQLFDIKQQSDKTFFNKDRINKYEELRLVFKGRTIRIISNRLSGDNLNRESLFVHFLFGAIRMYEFDFRDKPEIIEFKDTSKNGNQIDYSYAIYIPASVAFGDSSNWLFFDELFLENDWEPSSFSKMMIDSYIETFNNKYLISFSRYNIKGNLLRKYIKEYDFETKAKIEQDIRFDECIGLLGEFLAGFYLLKEQKITNLLELDFHRDIESTDIDVIGETEDCTIIFQVKTSLSFESKDHKEIFENFNKSSENIQMKDKTIRKILFVLKDSIDVENKGQEVVNFFKANNVETIFLKDLMYKLKREGVYSGFSDKLKVIFPNNKWEEKNE